MTRIRGRSSSTRAIVLAVLAALVAALAVGALLVLATGGTDEASSEPAPVGPPASGVGPGISVAEALAYRGTEPVLVRGGLLAESGTTRLCDGFRESFPPQCVEPALVVRGLDLDALDGVQRAGGVAWVDSTRLLGTVRDGVLTVSPTATG